MIILKDWSVMSDQNEFRAPELAQSYLQGEAYGHTRFIDGDHVKTSAIRHITIAEDYKAVETASGSVYAIYPEDIDSEYEKAFPGAYDALCIHS